MAILLIKYKTSRSLWAVFRIPQQFEQPRTLTCLSEGSLSSWDEPQPWPPTAPAFLAGH